ncbi:hypothetical protein NDU88_003989 [Pleurodeles waltl]|uniref:Uncharacterized protein n=1 Tax=Pleurodeles waltl TaxID=8319 RepID=A0AAV7WTT8_PLEWA|nr:hypothetical protein NDU88_003989 [Pleurodeles waltl]
MVPWHAATPRRMPCKRKNMQRLREGGRDVVSSIVDGTITCYVYAGGGPAGEGITEKLFKGVADESRAELISDCEELN